MSTKTMRPPPRRVPPPLGDSSSGSKLKERDHGPKTAPITKLPNKDKIRSGLKHSEKGPNLMSPNMLLAGYLAHEFLTKGTLLGRRMGRSASPQEESPQQKHERYVGLSLLLKTKGPNLCDIVNPTQLAHFLNL